MTDVNELALVDVVQILCMARRNVIASFHYPGGEVQLIIADGNVIDAHYKNLRGKRAFYRALAIDCNHSKQLKVTKLDIIPARRIFDPWKKLIFTGLKRHGFGVSYADFFP